MNKVLIKGFLLFSMIFLAYPAIAQDAKDYEHFRSFEGKKVESINVVTKRIKPGIVKSKFLMKEGDIFTYKDFDYARKAVHDMRIFKEVDIDVTLNQSGNLDINIKGEDGYYVLPLPIAMSNGGNTTVALMLLEANLFKRGELGTLMGAYSDDGYMGMLGLHLNDNSYNLFFIDQDYTQKMYSGGAYNSTGLFGNDDDDDDKTIINEYDVEKTTMALGYGRSLGEKFAFNLGYVYKDVDYKATSATAFLPDDAGDHHHFAAGVKMYHNIKPSKGMAGAFGSIFGLGTSDKEHKIANLPYIKPGYFISLEYINGASYSGSDYDISKLSGSVMGNLELKTRHTLYAVVNASQMFEGGLDDAVSSKDLLSGKGKYSTQYLGDKGFGGGLFGCFFLMKNKTAVMVLEPFIEASWLLDKETRYNQSGTGASLYVTFWRFQLPLGVNYTKDITNGDSTVSFVFGASF